MALTYTRARTMVGTLLAIAGVVAPFSCNAADRSERLSGFKPLAAFDSDEKLIGLYYSPNFVKVTIRSKPYLVMLQLSTYKNISYSRTPLYFATPDCAGPAYSDLYILEDALAPRAAVSIVGGREMAYPTTGDVTYVDFLSWRLNSGVCSSYTDRAALAVLEEPIDLTGRYRLPIHIK